MNRRHYLVTYDIGDDKRRHHVFTSLQGNGDHVQFSVFLCELNRRELAELRAQLSDGLHRLEDQVLILDLGPAHVPLTSSLESLGRAYRPPVRTMIV